MIFIAGVSPKTTILDTTPRLCPACGLARARMQRVDHWLSLFFIPVFRVKKGDAFLFCDRCDLPVNGIPAGPDAEPEATQTGCSACGRSLEKDHRFCPYCGYPREK
ncbi:MAG: zinc ribbon domain-containing protein [Desulfobacterales bacterium]|nr:zinc ribbon domain-containing protein [Desulfobacterales bacterium]